MENDDIFDDFGDKVIGKKEAVKKPVSEFKKEEHSESKFKEEKLAIKDRYEKEMRALEHKKARDMLKQGKIPSKNLASVERVTYIAILVVLLVYLVVDLSFFHGDKTTKIDVDDGITATVVQEDAPIEEPEAEEVVVEEPEEEEIQLSGSITLAVNKIYSEVDENNENVGEISKITITIDNGIDVVLKPLVSVYIYDEDSKEYYETRARGEYSFPAGIAPGKTHTKTIDLSPRKYSNLNLEKTIRIVLNDTEDGFVKAVTKVIIIS